MLKYYEKRGTQRPGIGILGEVLEISELKSSKCSRLAEMAPFLFVRGMQSLIT